MNPVAPLTQQTRPLPEISAQGQASATKPLFGVQIHNATASEVCAAIETAIGGQALLKIAFCNAHTANLAWNDPAYREVLSTFVVLPDGVGVDVGAKLLTGAPFRANLNGTDFVPHLLQAVQKPLRVALFGGRPGVAERAATAMSESAPHHSFGPVQDGYCGATGVASFLEALRLQPADLVLVALGNPLQELWIAQHLQTSHARVAMGVGALFDFMAGEVIRAPGLVRRLRLEWAWRLMLEPQRLFKRYVLGNPLFLLRVLAVKLGVRRFS